MKAYKNAGVDIEEGYKTVDLIKQHTKKTMIPGVMNGIGSFAAMFELSKDYKNPVIVSGTDGVGTKLDVAFKMKKYDTVGIDCVAMCVNDILCHGAKPIFFLDYLACGKLDANIAADLVKGVADGCVDSGCALVGGETAEMPGFYDEGKYDIAGFAVGIVEKDKIIDGTKIKEGDILIGLESSGVHSNGFSLVRKLFTDFDKDFNGRKIGDVLLTPTKIYVQPILKLIEKYEVKGMAHITGGGFIENIPRMSNGDFNYVIDKSSYEVPAIFKHMMEVGNIEESDMYNTYNMGIGYVVCVDKEIADEVLADLNNMNYKAHKIGHIEAGEKKVCIK